MKRKYLIAVALLAVLAVVFGLASTVTPGAKLVSPKQLSSDSVMHFVNPPTFDSGWVNITDKAGQYFNVTHNLNSTDIIVDLTGKTTLDGGAHRRHLGGTGYTPGWNRPYGGTDADVTYSVVQTSDGGYALAGFTYSFGAGGQDLWLVKTDPVGNMQWNRTYGGGSYDRGYSVVQTSDGGYALAGYTYSFGAGAHDFWLVKTDPVGNMQWNRTYGGTDTDRAFSMIQTSDEGYALAGATWSFGAGDGDFWLVKTGASGNMEWNQTYGGPNRDEAESVVQTVDEGYALVGWTESFGAGNYDFWLVKTDVSGNTQWNRTYGGTDHDLAYCVVQTSDGGYALAGHTRSFGAEIADFWLVKTDSTGNVQWNQTYGRGGRNVAYSVIQTSDGGYALGGYTDRSGAEIADFWLVKTDSTGNVQWNQTYGGIDNEGAYSMIQTSDGGYALAGDTYSFGAGGPYDSWLVKTGVESGLAWTGYTNRTITLYRGRTDAYWNYVRVRIWLIQEPTWQFGDINQDGIVDAQDLLILSQNYGKTFSLLSLMGIVGILGVQTYKTRKRPE